MLNLLVCPGIHPPELTQQFVKVLALALVPVDALQPETSPPELLLSASPSIHGKISYKLQVLSGGYHAPFPIMGLQALLATSLSPRQIPPVSLIAFSAGVVGAAQLAVIWQQLGGRIACLIALDGWGVPLWGDFPIYRLSHDWFTAWSSRHLSPPDIYHFYADPAVSHLDLWAAPEQALGTQLLASPRADSLRHCYHTAHDPSLPTRFSGPLAEPLAEPLTAIAFIHQALIASHPDEVITRP